MLNKRSTFTKYVMEQPSGLVTHPCPECLTHYTMPLNTTCWYILYLKQKRK